MYTSLVERTIAGQSCQMFTDLQPSLSFVYFCSGCLCSCSCMTNHLSMYPQGARKLCNVLVTKEDLVVCNLSWLLWFDPSPTAAMSSQKNREIWVHQSKPAGESEIEDIIIVSKPSSSSVSDFRNDSSITHLGQLTITYHDGSFIFEQLTSHCFLPVF